MVEAQFHSDSVLPGQREQSLESLQFVRIVFAAAFVFHFIEGMRHPDANIIAAAVRQLGKALLQRGEYLLFVLLEPWPADVHADRDKRLAVGQLEVARIGLGNPHVRVGSVPGSVVGRCTVAECGGNAEKTGGEQSSVEHVCPRFRCKRRVE